MRHGKGSTSGNRISAGHHDMEENRKCASRKLLERKLEYFLYIFSILTDRNRIVSSILIFAVDFITIEIQWFHGFENNQVYFQLTFEFQRLTVEFLNLYLYQYPENQSICVLL